MLKGPELVPELPPGGPQGVVGQVHEMEGVDALDDVGRLGVAGQLVGPAHVQAHALQPGHTGLAELVVEGLQDTVVLASPTQTTAPSRS